VKVLSMRLLSNICGEYYTTSWGKCELRCAGLGFRAQIPSGLLEILKLPAGGSQLLFCDHLNKPSRTLGSLHGHGGLPRLQESKNNKTKKKKHRLSTTEKRVSRTILFQPYLSLRFRTNTKSSRRKKTNHKGQRRGDGP